MRSMQLHVTATIRLSSRVNCNYDLFVKRTPLIWLLWISLCDNMKRIAVVFALHLDQTASVNSTNIANPHLYAVISQNTVLSAGRYFCTSFINQFHKAHIQSSFNFRSQVAV